MWDQVGQLYAYHEDVPAEVRLLKLTEEVGEVADAFIGMHGLNRRKGVCRTRDDLLAELADVIITAAVAMSGADRHSLATGGAAAAEHGYAGLGLHTRPKPVCFHAVAAVRLKCAFGHSNPLLIPKENDA